jgi:ribosomal protein S18 acetylase RimI-like enzyme
MAEMANPIIIRQAEPLQVDQIRQLTLRAYAKWVPVTPRKPRPMTADYDEAMRNHRFDLLYEGEALLGLIETVREGDELLIVNVAIEPGYHGKGFGTRLVRHAEQLAEASGLRGTRLYTNRLMAENIALYERLGYRFENETHHGAGMVAVHMVRPLS